MRFASLVWPELHQFMQLGMDARTLGCLKPAKCGPRAAGYGESFTRSAMICVPAFICVVLSRICLLLKTREASC